MRGGRQQCAVGDGLVPSPCGAAVAIAGDHKGCPYDADRRWVQSVGDGLVPSRQSRVAVSGRVTTSVGGHAGTRAFDAGRLVANFMGTSIQSDTPVRLDAQARAEYVEFACRLAQLAGEVILPQFRRPVAVDNKQAGTDYDPVTEADRAAERAMREEIRKHYPAHGILGEEFGLETGDGLTWVLDPIDGTRGYVMGLLHWGTLVALFDGERPVVGAIRQPVLDETFAGDGSSAIYTRSGEQRALATRPCPGLGEALAGTTAPEMFRTERQVAGFGRIRQLARGMRYGTDCYLYAMLAMGLADLVIEANLKPYDVQALMPVVEGAGGVITDWDGGNPAMGGDVLATGDARLHERVLEELRH